MRLRWMFTGGCLVLLMVFATLAQEAIVEIEPGTVEGTITQTFFSQRYRFQAEADETYLIRMERTSGNLDPLLFLFDSEEQFITDNDDFREGSRDAQITFTAEEEGPYIIEATRFQQDAGTTAGSFRLTLERESDIVPETPARDPLSTQPEFGVDFAFLEYGTAGVGTLNFENNRVDANRGAGMAYAYLATAARKVAEADADDLEEQTLVLLSQEEVETALFNGEFKVLPWTSLVALSLLHLKARKS